MARTPSTMTLNVRDSAPAFNLPDVRTQKRLSLDDLKGADALLVMFVCNHCPFVLHIEDELARIGDDYTPRGVHVVAISSNDVENYPDDSPEKMVAFAERNRWSFPYLYDESQSVAKDYFAACTPDFFLFDAEQKLVYRGQLDGSRPGNDVPVTGVDLRAALDALLSGQQVSAPQLPSLGCNIKWKPGNAPSYFA
ncbi:MAG: thioredoxin family protein [Myxococcota bacterium]|nr:thioredoxin family protein [Myxococcota bacterium]